MQRFLELLGQILTFGRSALTAGIITREVEVVTGKNSIEDDTYQSGNCQT
jgi:hypothetical protein